MVEFVKFFKFGMLFIVLSTIFIGIINGAITLVRDGKARPLLDATLGESLASDDFVYNAVNILKDQDLINQRQYPTEYLNFLREQTIISLFIFGIMIYLIHKLISFMFGSAILEMWMRILAVVISIVIYLVASMAYLFIYDITADEKIVAKEIIPIKGLISFFMNIDKIFSTTGVEYDISLSNTSISANPT